MSEEIQQEGAPAPADFAWQKEFALRGDLVQSDVYAFEAAANAMGGFTQKGSSIVAQVALKAAIEAGWLAEPAGEVLTNLAGAKRHFMAGVDVDKMHPGKVRWYGEKVLGEYIRAVAPPPN